MCCLNTKERQQVIRLRGYEVKEVVPLPSSVIDYATYKADTKLVESHQPAAVSHHAVTQQPMIEEGSINAIDQPIVKVARLEKTTAPTTAPTVRVTKPVIPETMEIISKTATLSFYGRDSPASKVTYDNQSFYSYPAVVDNNNGATYLRYMIGTFKDGTCVIGRVLQYTTNRSARLLVFVPEKKKFTKIKLADFKSKELAPAETIAVVKEKMKKVLLKETTVSEKKELARPAPEPLHPPKRQRTENDDEKESSIKENAKLKRQLDTLRSKYDDVQKQVKVSEKKVEELDFRNTSLREKYDNSKERLKDMTEDRDNLQSELASVTAELASVTEERDQCLEKLRLTQKSMKELDQTAKDLQEQVQQRDSKILKYEEEHKRMVMTQLSAPPMLPLMVNPTVMAPQNQMMYAAPNGYMNAPYYHYPHNKY